MLIYIQYTQRYKKMQCQQHPSRKISHKCITCHKYTCSQCSKSHTFQKHEIITSIELAQILKLQISNQIQKMNNKIHQLTTVRQYEAGQNIIINCMNQIIDFVKVLFQQIKVQFRKIADMSWKKENIESILDVQGKKNVFEEWLHAICKRSDQAVVFDAQKVYESHKIEEEQQLLDQSESYLINNPTPKIMFNQTALRRANQSITKIIYTQTKARQSIPKNLKKHAGNSSKRSLISNNYSSLCKFIQGTNILYQYIINDPEAQEHIPHLSKVQFRQFVVPYRSVCVTTGSHVYLVGGCSKQGQPRKQIMYFERAYTTMRVIGLLKQPRVSHAVCTHEDNIYTFGGRKTKTLEVFNTKSKISQTLAEFKQQILGASMTFLNGKLLIIGGTDGLQPNNLLYTYTPTSKTLQLLHPSNLQIYTMPISPILQPISETQLLIIGGYYSYLGQSYNNNYIILLDIKLNYLSVFGKGQLIYPILNNGNNCIYIDNKIICLADFKRLRHRHGPNMGVIFQYGVGEDFMGVDLIGL